MSYATSFTALRSMIGNPTLRCIRPWASQTVPAGYTYNATFKKYMSGSTIWEPTTASLLYDDVAILPPDGTATLTLTPGGIVDDGGKTLYILPASKTTVEAAAFFTLDGFEYVLSEVSAFPPGQPLFYTVRLIKR